MGKSTDGCTMVLPWFPCAHCARAISQAGIKRVVAPYPDVTDSVWGAEFKTALRILEKTGVRFDHFIDDQPPPKPRADGDPLANEKGPHRLPVEAYVHHWNTHRALPDAGLFARRAPKP